MSIESFKNSIKTQSLDEYIQYIVNVYAETAVNFDSKDGASLKELFRSDSTSAGAINREDFTNFYNKKLVADFMMLKGLYDEYMQEQDAQVKTNTYSVVANEIINAITPLKKYITLDSSRLRGGRQQVELEHKFVLNVNASDVFKVLRAVYETAVQNNIDFFITIPNIVGIADGVNDLIAIMCDTENLESTLRLLELLPSDIRALCKMPCPFGAVIDGWVGYSSVDNNSDIAITVGVAIMQGIDTAIREFAGVQADVSQYVQALDSGVNKDQTRMQVLKIMKELNPDMYQNIVNHIKTALVNNNIDLENIFLSKAVNAKLGGGSAPEVVPAAVMSAINEEVVPENNGGGAVPLVQEVPQGQDMGSEVNSVFNQGAEVGGEYRDPATDSVLNVGEIAPVVNDIDNMVSVPQGVEYPNVADSVAESAMQSLVDEGNKAVRATYVQMGITEEQLDTLVKDAFGNDITLFQYLDLNDTLGKISPNAKVTMSSDIDNADLNQVVTGSHFITKVVVPYALDSRLAYMDVDSIIKLYAKEISNEEPKKKSIFGGLFRKK